MIARTTLVTGKSASARETTICDLIAATHVQGSTAIIIEGLASGHDPFAALTAHATLQIVRIAPGCLCCSGNLTMRVTLNRLLRQRPAALYISLASSEHLEQIEAFLSAPPYTEWLTLAAAWRSDETT